MTARRVRSQSPFIPTQKELEKRARDNPLVLALRALPDASEDIQGPLSVEDLPIRVPGVRTELNPEQIQSALDRLAFLKSKDINDYAANSRRSMRSDWRHWIAYCVAHDRVAMPISLADITEFLDALIAAGYKRATLEHLLFTLKVSSQIWSCHSPTDSFEWKAYWRDRRRERLTKRQTQAPSMNFEDLDAIVGAVDDNQPRSIRDALFAACAYDLMARASELVAMRWDQIQFGADDIGGANYIIERAKTDQEGEGATTYLTPETVALLRAWRPHSCSENPYVFHALPRYAGQPIDTTKPLNVREAGRIFDRLAIATGIGKALSGHSARVGGAQDMTRAGESLPKIMQAGRWKSPRMPARYAEKELATIAGKGRRDAIARLRKK